MVKDDEEKGFEKKHAEEVLDRKAKATVQWNYIVPYDFSRKW